MGLKTIEKNEQNFLPLKSAGASANIETGRPIEKEQLSALALEELNEARRLLEIAYAKYQPIEYEQKRGHYYEKVLIENLRHQTKIPIYESTEKEDQFGHIDAFITINEHSYGLDFTTTNDPKILHLKKERQIHKFPKILIHIPEKELQEAINHSKSKIPGTDIPEVPQFIVEKMARQIADFIAKTQPKGFKVADKFK